MSKDKTGGPAFPVFPDTGGGHAAAFQGMTLRDYFAAKAMQTMCGFSGTYESHAKYAYIMADEMLRAREAKDD
jgi:hypothetical protein